MTSNLSVVVGAGGSCCGRVQGVLPLHRRRRRRRVVGAGLALEVHDDDLFPAASVSCCLMLQGRHTVRTPRSHSIKISIYDVLLCGINHTRGSEEYCALCPAGLRPAARLVLRTQTQGHALAFVRAKQLEVRRPSSLEELESVPSPFILKLSRRPPGG